MIFRRTGIKPCFYIFAQETNYFEVDILSPLRSLFLGSKNSLLARLFFAFLEFAYWLILIATV